MGTLFLVPWALAMLVVVYAHHEFPEHVRERRWGFAAGHMGVILAAYLAVGTSLLVHGAPVFWFRGHVMDTDAAKLVGMAVVAGLLAYHVWVLTINALDARRREDRVQTRVVLAAMLPTLAILGVVSVEIARLADKVF